MPPFSTEPKAGPSILAPNTSKAHVPNARESAIKAFMGSAGASSPVQPPLPVANPNQVSPEELSAIRPKEEQNNTTVEASSLDPSTPAPSEKQDPPKPAEDPLSSHYAQLARKERALRAKAQAQEQALKAKEAQIKAQEDALKAKEAQYQSGYVDKSKLTQDPLAVLNELGISYDQLTSLVMNAPNPGEAEQKKAYQTLQNEIKAIKEAQEQAQQLVRDQQKQAYDQALNQIRNEAKALVASDPEYSVIKSTNSVDDVVELIQKTFDKDGVLLSVEEAAKEVENFLTEEATKLYQIDKIRKKFEASNKASAVAPQPTGAASSQPSGANPPQKTLTNSVTSGKRMNAKERAILAFQGQLKS